MPLPHSRQLPQRLSRSFLGRRKEKLPSEPKVLIVGAGIGGLTLAILLEKAGIEYEIFERMKELKPLGSALCFNASASPIFKQMGIYEEYVELAKVCEGIQVCNSKREEEFFMDYRHMATYGGDKSRIISRPEFHALLLRQIPPERLHLDHRILTFLQGEQGVMIQTSDKKTHDGDILVGADGAQSVVRKSLYEELRHKRALVKTDDVPLPLTCVCLVGQTRALERGLYPELEEEQARFVNHLGDTVPYSWSTMTTKQDTICWSVTQYLDKPSTKDAVDSSAFASRHTEWGPEAAEAMCKMVRDFAISSGRLTTGQGQVESLSSSSSWTLGDLIDQTPKELISRVMLDEMVYETWYDGRTVLLGDACHKLNPSGGLGAQSAIHDAVVLANWISVLPSTKLKATQRAFKRYREERLGPVKESLMTSQLFTKLTDESKTSKAGRFMFKNMPHWLYKLSASKSIALRPQVSFLPRVEDSGSVKATYQPSYHKTLKRAKASFALASAFTFASVSSTTSTSMSSATADASEEESEEESDEEEEGEVGESTLGAEPTVSDTATSHVPTVMAA